MRLPVLLSVVEVSLSGQEPASFRPQIPRTWDDGVMADLELPLPRVSYSLPGCTVLSGSSAVLKDWRLPGSPFLQIGFHHLLGTFVQPRRRVRLYNGFSNPCPRMMPLAGLPVRLTPRGSPNGSW